MVWPAASLTSIKKRGRKSAVKAKIVVLAASCCETARILLNSKNSQFPNGVANSSGLVGKYIMDTVGSDVSGFLPILQDLPPFNEDGIGGMHLYMPWWLYNQQKAGKMDFARGYHIEIGGGRKQPGAGELGAFAAFSGRRLRSGTEDQSAQAFRLCDRICRPRRDDPQ